MFMEDPLCAIGLKLKGRRVVFAGAGTVAERRLLRLLNSGALFTVIAPEPTAEIEQLAQQGRITLERRRIEPEDFKGAFLAFIATGNDQLNAELADAARAQGALVNHSDNPKDCDFVLPALAWMNTVHIGVFSESPVLSNWVRRHLELTLGPEFPEFAAAFAEIRQRVRNLGLPQSTRTELLTRLLNEGLYHTYRTSGMKAAMQRADALAQEYRGSKEPQA